MQVHEPNLAAVIAEDLVEHVAAADMASMVNDSYLPVDLCLFEGGVAQRFLDTRGPLLPTDEEAMLRDWIGATRSVYEVVRSRPGTMDVVDLATRTRMTVDDTVPDEPLETGWKIIGRLVPVGDLLPRLRRIPPGERRHGHHDDRRFRHPTTRDRRDHDRSDLRHRSDRGRDPGPVRPEPRHHEAARTVARDWAMTSTRRTSHRCVPRSSGITGSD